MNESDDQETTQVWNELKPERDEALMALPEKHRDVVVFRYLEGKSNDEAAITLGMTPSAVSTCLARAIDKLRGHFQRRGIVVGTVILSAALAKNASAAVVPASIGSSVMAAAAGGAVATAVTANVALMVEGALSSMAWVKTKVIALIGILVTSGALLGIYGLQLRGNATYSITIRKLAIGNDGEKLGYKYGIDGVMDAGWRGKGTFSKARKQLPDNYRRLLSE